VEKIDILLGHDEAVLSRPGSGIQVGVKKGKLFAFFTEVEITLSLDAFDTIALAAPFDASNKVFREVFRPFKYKPARVLANLETMFDGTCVDIRPGFDAQSKTVSVEAYSKPGVYHDCTADVLKGAHKLEWHDCNLRTIAEQLSQPFGIDVEFRGLQPGEKVDPGPKFKKVAIGLEKKIHEFLADLAKQRTYVMTNSREGRLLFWKSVTESVPVARLVEGVAPVSKVEPNYSAQEYYSHITGFTPWRKRRGGNSHTFPNPWLDKVYRPISCKFDDTEKADAAEATRAKAGRMFGNIASWVIDDLPGWRDPNGDIWQPNRTVTLLAPDAMVYSEVELIIRNAKLHQNATKEWTTLEVVLPGSFSGEIPKKLPWDEPE